MPVILSRTARAATTSAIRDLLEHAGRPGMISLAGGLPDAELFPTGQLAELAGRLLRERGREVLQYGPTAGDPALRDYTSCPPGHRSALVEVVAPTGHRSAW